MPQLSFDKETTPHRLSIQVSWKQLSDEWTIEVFTYSQSETLQSVAYTQLPQGFHTMEVGMLIERLFEDWCDVTPGYACSMFSKGAKHLQAREEPNGLHPMERSPRSDLPPGHGQRSPRRTFPPYYR